MPQSQIDDAKAKLASLTTAVNALAVPVDQPQIDAVHAATIAFDASAGALTVDQVQPPPPDPTLPPGFTSVSVAQTDQYAPVQGTNQRWNLNLHGSGGAQLAHGDQLDIVVDETMGHVAGQVFRLAAEKKVIGTETTAQLEPADRVWLTRPGYLTNTWMETLWRGYILDNNTTSPAVPYTERRLDAAIAYARATKYPWLSATKVTASGGSMGAWGMMTYALRRPQVFAAIFASRPRWRDINYADWAVGFAKDYHGNPMADVPGQTVAQRQDHVAYVTDPANAIPFLVFALGRADGYGKFSDFTDAIAALRATGRGFACYWNAGNHSDPDIVNMTALASYAKAMFEVGVGYPVLSASSLDNDPAVDQVGGVNLGFSWTNVQESATAWSCDVANALGAVTVTVTPHSSIFPGAPPQTVTIPAGQTITLSFSAGQASPEQPPSEPEQPPAADAQIVSMPLDLRHIVALAAQFDASDRYNRYEIHKCFTTDVISEQFYATLETTSEEGKKIPLLYPQYGLLFNGVERARAVVKNFGKDTGAVFTGNLASEMAGPYKTKIVAYDAAGNRVASPVESLMEFWVWVDRDGTAKNVDAVVYQNGSYEWTHGNPNYQYAVLTKAQAKHALPPLAPRVAVPFNTTLAAKSIARINISPPTDLRSTPNHVEQTTRGILVTESKQSYFAKDVFSPWSALPLVDGVRGECSSEMLLCSYVGRDGKTYACHPQAFVVYDQTGAKRTLFGLRHKYRAYHGELAALGWNHPAVEFVGVLGANVPPGTISIVHEAWSIAFDERSTVNDKTLPIPPGETEPQHPGDVIALLPDSRGWVWKLTFSGKSHAAPCVATILYYCDDPWTVRCRKGVAYVTVRNDHRVAMVDIDTGAFLGDFVNNKAGGESVSNGFKFVSGMVTGSGKDRRVWAGQNAAACRAQPMVAPEGMWVDDAGIDVAALAQKQVVHWPATYVVHPSGKEIAQQAGAPQVMVRPAYINANSRYMLLEGCRTPDEPFGPIDARWLSTWTNASPGGRPSVHLPKAGFDTDGTPMTHTGGWTWNTTAYYSSQGAAGTESSSYSQSVSVAHGRLACTSAEQGLAHYLQADPALDTMAIDVKRLNAGGAEYFKTQQVVSGAYGLGGIAPKRGISANVDYFLDINGAP